jgi:protein-disulfide isomerase
MNQGVDIMAKKTSHKRQAKKKTSSYWIIGGVLGAAILVLALVLINTTAPRPAPVSAQVSAGRTLGQAGAPVTIDLYSDFQCPVCRRAELELREIIPAFIDNGKAKIVYHNFAFIGSESTWAAQAAECANDQGQFWPYASYLFDHQTGENVGAFSQANLKQFAAALKLDTAAFDACLDSGKHAALVQSELEMGRARGVRATPTFFINGSFVEGLLSAQQLGMAIDSQVAEQ